MTPNSPASLRPTGWAVLAFIACLGGAAFAVTPGPKAEILVPMASTAAIGCAFLAAVVTRGGGRHAVLELGPVYAAVVTIYALYPLLGFLVNGLRFGDLDDNRLFVIQPTAKDVAGVAWLYVAHLGGFALAYAAARGRTAAARLAGRYVSRFALVALLGLWLVIQLYFAALQRHYDWHFETNFDRYVAIANLPRLVAQVTGHLGAIQFTAEVAVLVLLFAALARRALLFVVPWIGVVAAWTVSLHQSRTELVLLTLAAVVCFHLEVRPISAPVLSGLAVAGIAGFLLFGATRDGFAAVDLRPSQKFFVANEFESLFGNACDLRERVRSGEVRSLPPNVFLSDLLALVPQQLMPVAKESPAVWYMRSFFPEDAERGVGFCFGTISESVVGGGAPDAIARGALLGLLFGAIHRFVSRRRPGPWWFIFYVWLTVMAYNSFRMTTFYLLLRTLYDFLTVVVLVKGAHALFGICRRGFATKTAAAAVS